MTTRKGPPTGDSEESAADDTDSIGPPAGTIDSWLGFAEAPIEVVEEEPDVNDGGEEPRGPGIPPYVLKGKADADLEAPVEDAVEAEVVRGTDRPFEPPTMGWPGFLYKVTAGGRLYRPEWRDTLQPNLVESTRRREDEVAAKSNRLNASSTAFGNLRGLSGKSSMSANVTNIWSMLLRGRRFALVVLNQAESGHWPGLYDRARPVPKWVHKDPQNGLSGYGMPTGNILELFTTIRAGVKDFPNWAVNGEQIKAALNGAHDDDAIKELVKFFQMLKGRAVLDPEQILEMMQTTPFGVHVVVATNDKKLSIVWVRTLHSEVTKHFDFYAADMSNNVGDPAQIAVIEEIDSVVVPVNVEMPQAFDNALETLYRIRQDIDPSERPKVDNAIIVLSGLKSGGPTVEHLIDENFVGDDRFENFGGNIVGVPESRIIRNVGTSRPDLLLEKELRVYSAHLEIIIQILDRLPAVEVEQRLLVPALEAQVPTIEEAPVDKGSDMRPWS